MEESKKLWQWLTGNGSGPRVQGLGGLGTKYGIRRGQRAVVDADQE